jgi:hypothetical protein
MASIPLHRTRTRRAAPGAVDPRLVLPFEGDMTLSIILSKAFLLAADDEITDASIVRQIRGW